MCVLWINPISNNKTAPKVTDLWGFWEKGDILITQFRQFSLIQLNRFLKKKWFSTTNLDNIHLVDYRGYAANCEYTNLKNRFRKKSIFKKLIQSSYWFWKQMIQ